MSRKINVAAAVILRDQHIFAAQRSDGANKDKWEFPGGKINPGETPEQAVKREIREELNMEIETDEKLDTVDMEYHDFHLTMHCFLCHIVKGNPTLLEHESARWINAEELYELDWLPADRKLLARIKERCRAQ